MKGIILAGGRGSRLYPTTLVTCKQLLPIYDKPLIYYPLSILMMAKIREILIIANPEDLSRFKDLFGDGSQLGLSIEYEEQSEPKGIADAFLIGEAFIDNGPVALILGDNIFYGHNMSMLLDDAKNLSSGATVFGYEVQDPERYGVLAFDDQGRITNIIEKPAHPPSCYAVTGLYFYDQRVVEITKHLKPSPRGELEITDVNIAYLRDGSLSCKLLDRGFAWLDTGTPTSMQQASNYVETIQNRQGIQIGCIEEIAYKLGYIDQQRLIQRAEMLSPSEYARYLFSLCASPTFA